MKNTETEPRKIDVTDGDAPNDTTVAAAAAANEEAATAVSNDTLLTDLDRFRDLALRAQADLENFKKRAAREKEDAIKYANSSLLERLIAIVDNFELGLCAARSESAQSPVLAGMGMVLKQLSDFLADNGLQPIDAEGKKFDPNLHEAISHEASAAVPEGNVVRQMRRGYKLKDRLLRPSTEAASSGPGK